MSNMFNVTVTTKINPEMKNFKNILNAGLTQAGKDFGTAKGSGPGAYPPTNSKYVRTYNWANTPAPPYNITAPGKTMELSGMFYGRFILKGTVKWIGWPGHLDGIKQAIIKGFKHGVGEAASKL